jgi:hypothetical protein
MMTEAIYSGGPAVPSHHFVLWYEDQLVHWSQSRDTTQTFGNGHSVFISTGSRVSTASKNMFQIDTYTYLDAYTFSMLIPLNMKSILYTIL